MRFFATLAVVFVAAVVFVSATPIPSEYQFDLDTREFSVSIKLDKYALDGY